MTDTPNVRRVNVYGPPIGDFYDYTISDHDNGTHALVPWETWERVRVALQTILTFEPYSPDEEAMVGVARRALDEIGGEDG